MQRTAWYITRLLVKLTPKSVVFSFLFFSFLFFSFLFFSFLSFTVQMRAEGGGGSPAGWRTCPSAGAAWPGLGPHTPQGRLCTPPPCTCRMWRRSVLGLSKQLKFGSSRPHTVPSSCPPSALEFWVLCVYHTACLIRNGVLVQTQSPKERLMTNMANSFERF